MSSRLRAFAVINEPNVGARPDPSVAIDLADTDRGFLPNRLTTDQRDAIDSPPEGLTIYNTDTQTHETFDGATWQAMTKGSPSTFLQVANNLSDVADVPTSRTHLGLGDAATHAASDFDAAGAAAAAQAASLQKSANLSDVADAATARSNLGLSNLSESGIDLIYAHNDGAVRSRSAGAQFNNFPKISVENSQGDIGSPSNILSGNVLGQYHFRGWNGSQYISGAIITVSATEDWGSATGAILTIATITTGNAGPNPRFQIDGSGHIILPSLPGSDPHVVGALWNNAGVLTVSAG